MPDKMRLAKEYLGRSLFFFDTALILKTLPKMFGCRKFHRDADLPSERTLL